jgi:hypothetical protein
MHLGKYALVADCCRILINQHNQLYQEDRRYEIPFGCDINNVWILRAIAFAAMGKNTSFFIYPHCEYIFYAGSTYLSHLHFKSAQSNGRSAVQGYKECCEFLSNEEITQSETFLSQSYEVSGHNSDIDEYE